jgi:hypothetical protein
MNTELVNRQTVRELVAIYQAAVADITRATPVWVERAYAATGTA